MTELPQIKSSRPDSAKLGSPKENFPVVQHRQYEKRDFININNHPCLVNNMPQRAEKPMATSNTTCSNQSQTGDSTTDTRSDPPRKIRNANSSATTRSIKTRSPASVIDDHPPSGDPNQGLETLFEKSRNGSGNNNTNTRISGRKKLTHSKSTVETEVQCFSSSNRTPSYGSLQNGNHKNNKNDDHYSTNPSRGSTKRETLQRHQSDLGMVTRQASNLTLRQPPHQNKQISKKPPSFDASPTDFFLDDESKSDHEEEKRYYIMDWLNGVYHSDLEVPQSPIIDEEKPTQTDTAFHIVYNGD